MGICDENDFATTATRPVNSVLNKILLAAITIIIGALFLRGVANPLSNTDKTWKFKLQAGVVKIDLLASSSFPGAPSLGIVYEDGAHPSIAEEVGFIQEVVHQLPSLGVDPRNLRGISFRGFAEPEVARSVATAALHSKSWQSFTTLQGGAERVVQDLLNSLGSYDRFNDAFQEYGLRVRIGAVEKVSDARCLDLKISDALCTVHHNPRLPTGANLELSIEKRMETPAGVKK